jgi:AcrR family transcriptional regulator
MTTRDDVLDAMQHLVVSTGSVPSLQDVARVLGITKQGVLHHFPTRSALDSALAVRAVARVDDMMRRAAHEGSPSETYLRLSAPSDEDRAAAFSLLASLGAGALDLPPEVQAAATRWQQLMAAELGDPVQAEIVRLVGDGLFSEALVTGRDPAPERVDRLVARLVGRRRSQAGGS